MNSKKPEVKRFNLEKPIEKSRCEGMWEEREVRTSWERKTQMRELSTMKR